MIYCSSCGTANRDGSKFCNECGTSLRQFADICPYCQARNPLTNRFCGSCGRPLPVLSEPEPASDPGVSWEPEDPADLEDELPSLEADVPSFTAPESPSVESTAEPSDPVAMQGLRPSTGLLGDLGVRSISLHDLALTREDLILIQWYEAGEADLDSILGSISRASSPASLVASRSEPLMITTLPDWLDLGEDSISQADQGQVVGEVTNHLLPDWLSLPDEPSVVSNQVTTAPDYQLAVLPSWLELVEEAVEDVAVSAAPSAPEPQMVDLPSWLSLEERQPEAVEPPPPAPQEPSPISAELPEWLSLPEPSWSQSPVELPSWLSLEEPPLAPAEPAPVVLSAEPLSLTCQLPSWLELSEPDLPVSIAPDITGRSLPDWLSLSDEPVEQESATATPTPRPLPAFLFISEEAPPGDRGLPDWLLAEEPAAVETLPAVDLRSLPHWLDMEEAFTDGPRTGDDLELDLALAADGQSEPMAASFQPDVAVAEPEPLIDVPVAPAQKADAALQGIVLARPLQTPRPPTKQAIEPALFPDYTSSFSEIMQPKVEPRILPSLPAFQRSKLISVLLIIVLLVALIPQWGLNLDPGRSTTEVYDAIQTLPSTSNVLVSFDWTPGDDYEMAPIAEAVVRHLVQRKVRIVAVSLVPEGAKLAQRVLDESVPMKSKNYAYGERVVNLGYLPGEEAAIQNMLRDGFAKSFGVDYYGKRVSDLPILQETKSIMNVDLVVLLSDKPDMTTKWITQLSASYPGIRMVAGISAGSLPWVKPFTSGSPRQLKGVVTGLRGAAEYEVKTPRDPNVAKGNVGMAAMDAQSFGGIFLVLVIIFGNLALLRERRKDSKLAGKVRQATLRS